MIKMNPLAVTIVARNEAERYLEPVLKQVEQYADGIVLIDNTRGEDKAADMARGYGAKVIEFPYDDFTQARPIAWEAAIEYYDPLFILALDADELLFPHSLESLELVMESELDVIGATRYHAFYSPFQVRVDGAWNPSYNHIPVMMRVRPKVPYTLPTSHQSGDRPRLSEEGMSMTPLIMLNILHLGYAHPEDIEHKHKTVAMRSDDNLSNRHKTIATTPSLMPLPYNFPKLAQLIALSPLWPDIAVQTQAFE